MRYFLAQLVRFRDRQKFVKRVEPGEIIALAAVEKTFLPDVNVKKPEQRTERQSPGESLERAF